jgi:hypothetical protein
METAKFVALFTSIFVPILVAMLFLPLILSGKQQSAARDKARARRIADAKMNARLLRMNL